MTPQQIDAMKLALDFLMTRRMGAESVIDALQAALAQPEQEPVTGWALVPVKPTVEIMKAAMAAYDKWAWRDFPALWESILKAALNMQPKQEPVAMARFNCWTTNDGDSWFDDPADADLICDMLGNEPKVGDEFEVMAGWRAVPTKYRVTAVTEDGDCEVDCISHPHKNTTPPKRKPLSERRISDLMPTNSNMSRTDELRWMARAVEREHDIKEQP